MKRFCLILVKPSHYDDDGYVIQWVRSPIPSNSLAALYGLAKDCAARLVLGAGVDMTVHALDETNAKIRPAKLAAMIEAAGSGLVMMVGVQSNQFPRALDLAKRLRARRLQVIIGGFHVSGVMSMLGGADAGLDRARAMGVSLFAGEAEGRLDDVLRDAARGSLQPLYDFSGDLPSLAGAPIPVLTAERASRIVGAVTSFDAGRGCPYQCSFCTIINVQGRTSRRRSPDDIEAIVRVNCAQGLHSFFITDDNFARNKDWEPILDRLIHLREVEKLRIGFIIQVDTLCHRIPRFIEKCARAGVRRVFIGLESINPDNLAAAKKRQNRITEYRQMLLSWKAARVITYAGFIIGFPGDTPESVLHDIDVIKRELPIDVLEFFNLTPLPGSEDHQTLYRAGVAVDADLNRYDLHHVTTGHARMSREEWERVYRLAWKRYYTLDHLETVFRRAVKSRANVSNAVLFITWFMGSIGLEGVHPLESGFLRRKSRRDRRPGLAIEPAWRFYPAHIAASTLRLMRWAALYARLWRLANRARRDPRRLEYTDLAMTPVTDADIETLELFHTDAARSYVDKERRLAAVLRGEIPARDATT